MDVMTPYIFISHHKLINTVTNNIVISARGVAGSHTWYMYIHLHHINVTS